MSFKYGIKGLLPLAISTGILILMLIRLMGNVSERFEITEKKINTNQETEGIFNKAIVLTEDTYKNYKILADILYNNNYCETPKDALFISQILSERLKEERLPYLYALNKRKYGYVSAKMAADSCALTSALTNSNRDLGLTDSIFEYKPSSIYKGSSKITVSITDNQKEPMSDVFVRLQLYYRDSTNNADTITLGYKKTDSKGLVSFEGLDNSVSYSVLPIKEGFEFGNSKGGKFNSKDELTYNFSGEEHLIPMFGNKTLSKMKSDGLILVRSPEEYKAEVIKWFIILLLGWWIVALFSRIRAKKLDGVLIASGMFLTGLCVIMMYSLSDPLNDEMKGTIMAIGVIIGLAIILLLQFVDFIKLYQNKNFDIPMRFFCWLFEPFRQKITPLAETMKGNSGALKKLWALMLVVISLPTLLLDLLQITRLSGAIERFSKKLPKGFGWLMLAVFITALLWTPLGREIGGMKVNINLAGIVFQPSEIAKYLILFFIAAFFTQYADTIIEYSKPDKLRLIKQKVKTLIWVILGLLIIMAMYISLGDMGPGLVITLTFIILYSLIKSKVNLENLDEDKKWQRIFTCDFAMLIYGVATFVGAIIAGQMLGNALIFGLAWFVVWVLIGYFVLNKQLFESPMLMNAIIFIFIFGGTIMSGIPFLKDSETVERFESRTHMCVNTWGDLDIENKGENADPVSNIQVASGLWGLATGGFSGQGLANGKPTYIPAYHTDMILSSIGEQLGWIGLLGVVLVLFVLLRRILITGYKTGHPFAFYICLGIAVVTGVQFFIIALGSSGMIPLTGVTVPFLSYGRVSMILNMTAFGIVLSLGRNAYKENKQTVNEAMVRKNVEQYAYPIAFVTLIFVVLAAFLLSVWNYYQVINRDNTIIHRAYVLNNNGLPLVEYNPRIALLTQNMTAGRIYDRNGILLATSNKADLSDTSKYYKTFEVLGLNSQVDEMRKRELKRYYPLGEQTFFMVGDINENLFPSYNEKYPVGYMADIQHLSLLRGYDNILRDDYGKDVKVQLKSNKFKDNKYLDPICTSETQTIRDYSFLIEYLKEGINGDKLKQHNAEVDNGAYDLYLTIDAKMQVEIQNKIKEHIEKNEKLKNNNLLRVSVVVLDAKNGDLLTSANYPLPDYARLHEEGDRTYYDNGVSSDWHSYTDRDLGTTSPTPPGSTAKIMSAMAGLNKDINNKTKEYYIYHKNIIDIKFGEPEGTVNMERAIKGSSNCYFIHLVNDQELMSSYLSPIYQKVGAEIYPIVPYYYTMKTDSSWRKSFEKKIAETEVIAYRRYKNFMKNPSKESMKKKREWEIAWGQGDLKATPLNMARVASAVINKGKMPYTQYILNKNLSDKKLRNDGSEQLTGNSEANVLKSFMKVESNNRTEFKNTPYIGGKSGTPEREYKRSDSKTIKINDGWYVFFIDNGDKKHSLAVAVRMERLIKGMSRDAVTLAKEIISVIGDLGYIYNYKKNNK